MGPPERQETIATWTLKLCAPLGPHIHQCHKWNELQLRTVTLKVDKPKPARVPEMGLRLQFVIPESRTVGHLATTMAGIGTRAGGQEDTTVQSPGVTAVTKL